MKAPATLLLSLLALLFSACTTPVAINPESSSEPQTAKYRAGYFYGPVDAESHEVFRVAIRKMDELGYFRTGELHKNSSITIYARKTGDKKVTVRISQLAPGRSQIRIRYGTYGDLAESQTLYSQIRKAL